MPPPKKDSWQFWVSWILFDIGMISSGLIGFIDFDILGYGFWIRILVGGLAIFLGGGVVLWGVKTLSTRQSFGLKGKLVTEGPYRYSQNPQDIGFILMYAGVILVTFSFMALVAGSIMIVDFVILPLSEEPWLIQQYGEAYVEYCRHVPRFIGFRSFKHNGHIFLSWTLCTKRVMKLSPRSLKSFSFAGTQRNGGWRIHVSDHVEAPSTTSLMCTTQPKKKAPLKEE